MTVELWIDEEYFDKIKDSLDMDKIYIRATFDENVREEINMLYKQIHQLKIYGHENNKK